MPESRVLLDVFARRTVFDVVMEWFEDTTAPARRQALLDEMRARKTDRGPFHATVQNARVGLVTVADLAPASTWPRFPLYRGCVLGGERGASWTPVRIVANQYARVRGGRVVGIDGWWEHDVLGVIESRVPAGGVTEEILIGDCTDRWWESVE